MLAAAVAMKMIGIDGARGFNVIVERATDLVVRRERQTDQFGQWRDAVGQVGDKIFVIVAFNLDRVINRANIVARVIDVAVDRRSSAASSGFGVLNGSTACSGGAR